MINTGADFALGTFVVNPTVDTLISKVTDAVTAPFMAATEVMDAPGVFVTSVVWGLGGSIAGGIVARKRSAAAKDPMLGFLY
jgi:hypothetical protein